MYNDDGVEKTEVSYLLFCWQILFFTEVKLYLKF